MYNFSPEQDSDSNTSTLEPWNILVVDDEQGVHQITEISLSKLKIFPITKVKTSLTRWHFNSINQ